MSLSITDVRRLFFGTTDEELATLTQAAADGVTLADLISGGTFNAIKLGLTLDTALAAGGELIEWDDYQWGNQDWHEAVINPERITVPDGVGPGFIRIEGQLFDEAGAGWTNPPIYVRVNNTTDYGWYDVVSGLVEAIKFSMVLPCEEGDYFSIKNNAPGVTLSNDSTRNFVIVSYLGNTPS